MYNIKGEYMLKKDNEIEKKHLENKDFFKDDKKAVENDAIENRIIDDGKLDSSIVIRIKQKHKNILENHFKNYRGITLSSGIKDLIFNYMRENKLI